uniref:Zn(2)-C6 fungal-type domain-containing protein n=1 Tax=Lotharella oceanica TaxID=641309 RepID=A0A7S2TQB9_9EUKA|mmetsp:Transcript_22024/g.41267  ORF Transcript_22024/g.41267 Transcript_22024/m.41267 type:complete len:349 (+) Transcript_22024:84-1130(+)
MGSTHLDDRPTSVEMNDTLERKSFSSRRPRRSSTKDTKYFEPSAEDFVDQRTPSRRPQRRRARNHLRSAEGTRIRVKTACTNCKLAKARCDNGRPCGRCVRRGCESTCVDAVPKRRGRKRNHDISKSIAKPEEPEEEEAQEKTVEEVPVVKSQPREECEEESEKEADDVKLRAASPRLTVRVPKKKKKRRKIVFSAKRLDYLAEKDTFEDEGSDGYSSETELRKYVPTDSDALSHSPTPPTIEIPSHVDSPAFFVRSPNNTMSDKEFNDLLVKHENEHSTPEFSGALPNFSSAEKESTAITPFNLASMEPMSVGGTLPSVSPSPFPLNALIWSENGPAVPPTFSKIFS